jgi:hypothetical protein
MKHLFVVLGCVGLAAIGHHPIARAQSASFGEIRYAAPEESTKQTTNDRVEFTSIDNKRKTYLKLAIFAMTASSGDLAVDGQIDWTTIAVKMFGASATPSATQNATLAGAPAIFLTGSFTFDKRITTITTFTTRLGNRKATVLAMSTDIDYYLPVVRAFLASISSSVESPTQPSAATPATQPNPTAPVAVAELYNLSLPKHFSLQKAAASIIATDTATNTSLTFLPAMAGTGNLAADAQAVLAAGFPGWQPMNGWQQNSTRVISSTTSGGVPYVVLHQDLEQGERKIIGTALVFGIGDKQIAPVFGRTEHLISGINWNGYEAILSTYTLVAHAVNFKNLKAKPFSIALESSTWQSISSSAGLVLTFNPKGTFTTGAATRTSVSHSATQDKVTSTSWSNDGSWSLNGSLLTMVYRATKTKSQSLLRIAVEECDGRRAEFLGMLDLGTGGEVRLSRSK